MSIAIIGAGLGGLAAALALQRLGHPVSVYERSAHMSEVGAGITLHPNATKALTHLGLGEAIAATGVAVQHTAIKHYKTNQVLVETKKGGEHVAKFGAHLYQIHRADVHHALERAVRAHDPHCIKTNHALIDIQNLDDAVALYFDSDVTVMAEAAIGCDGIKSTVRAKMFSPAPPVFTGRIAYRGVLPRTLVSDEMIWPGSGVWIGPERTFGAYVMRAGTLVNFVATVRKHAWTEEGWSISADRDEVLAEFSEWHPFVQDIIRRTPGEALFKWGLFSHAPLQNWVHGRVAVLGDAAHPMLPFMGQGAAQAFEDAVILARCIDGSPGPAAALRRYQAARQERATFVQLESAAKADRWESANPENYSPANHRNEDTLGVVAYDAATAPI
ncbi:MAG: FAD-dependent monooxygenase [Rhodospirillaceae bacterium]|nr:FAD-dependent monooxygenase [Rhodospirillaceae bacterium]